MSNVPQVKIPATYMRGGTSKGVFFNLTDLPESCQVASKARDNMLYVLLVALILIVNKPMVWVEQHQVLAKS